MREGALKSAIRRCLFPIGAIRTIRLGPMKGMVFRVGLITGLSPWYSGPERFHQRTFQRMVRAGDVVMDVGANWGMHALYLSRLVGPSGLVIAVEPLPEAVRELQWHLQANRCLNVTICPMALSDADGEAHFVREESFSEGHLVDNSASFNLGHQPISVVTRTLDAVVSELGITRLRLLKIDVEGAEMKVLAGAQKTLDEFRPSLVVDLHISHEQRRRVVAMLQQRFHYRVEPYEHAQWGIVAWPPAVAGGAR